MLRDNKMPTLADKIADKEDETQKQKVVKKRESSRVSHKKVKKLKKDKHEKSKK